MAVKEDTGGCGAGRAEAHLQITESEVATSRPGRPGNLGKGDEIKLLLENHHFVATEVRIIRDRPSGRGEGRRQAHSRFDLLMSNWPARACLLATIPGFLSAFRAPCAIITGV